MALDFDQDVDIVDVTLEVYDNHGETQLSYNSAGMDAAVQLDDRIRQYSNEEMRCFELEEWWGIPASLAGLSISEATLAVIHALSIAYTQKVGGIGPLVEFMFIICVQVT